MKYAVFTMDLEAFSDNDLISSSGLDVSDPLLEGFDNYMDLLEKNNIHGTIFALCDTVHKIKEKVRCRLEKGHELALHGLWHKEPTGLPNEEFAEQLTKAKEKLKADFGVDVKGYRAPCFSMNNEKLEVLKANGFGYDSSRLSFPLAYHVGKFDTSGCREHENGVFDMGGITEFSLPTGKFLWIDVPIGGGAYVRLFRWWIMKNMIRRYIRKNNFYVFYVHPYEVAGRISPAADQFPFGMRFYLKRGILKYPSYIQQIIDLLKAEGYKFVTFGEYEKIVGNEAG